MEMSERPSSRGIIGYVAGVGADGQRRRIVSALAQAGLTAVEIVVENPYAGNSGKVGLARVYEYMGRSDIDTLVLASYDLVLHDPLAQARWKREVAVKYGVRVVEVGNSLLDESPTFHREPIHTSDPACI